jgi:hypothetical protein
MDKIVYSWFNEEKTIILCEYLALDWDWNDFHDAFQRQKAMIDSVTYPKVHVIVDTTRSNWLPKGGSLLSGMRKLTDLKHPRQGHTIIVGAKGLLAAVANTITKLMGKHRQEIHLVDTLEEARQLVATFPTQAKTI